MKKFKALTASILASAMAMSMTTGFAAFAATADPDTQPEISDPETPTPEPETPPAPSTPASSNITKGDKGVYTISVQPSNDAVNDKNATHKYEAYQIFTAEMIEDTNDGETTEKFSVTGWGTGVDAVALVDALQKDKMFNVETTIDGGNTVTKNLFFDVALTADSDDAAKIKAAQDVAEVLTNTKYFDYDNDMVREFAKIVGDNISASPIKGTSTKEEAFTDIEVPSAGYYIIKDTEDSPTGTMDVHDKKETFEKAGKTRYILTPTNTINPSSKADYPTIDKNIVEDGELKDYNTASIGDVVTYQLDSKVPNMDGYNQYYYIVNDSMFEGLTLDESSISVTVGGADAEFYFKDNGTSTKDGDKYNDFSIVLVNFIQYKESKGKDIVITYNANLNEDAKIGKVGNPNFVDLTFSNNPNYNYEGIPAIPPSEDNPEGEPPKPYEPNPGKPGTPPDEENPDGTPGTPGEPTGTTPEVDVITYTTGIELTKVDSKDTTKTLKGAEFKIEGDGVKWIIKNGELLKDGEETQIVKNLVVDDDGVLKIDGLNAGTYTITETKAPEGYVLKNTPITVTISADPSLKSCTWTYDTKNATDPETNTDNGTLSFKVTNPKGITLPGTGAFGSKLMYALGTIFTGTGVSYMISKKKSKKEE